MKSFLLLLPALFAGAVVFCQTDSLLLIKKLPAEVLVRRQLPVANRDPRMNMTFEEKVQDSLNRILKQYAYLPDVPDSWAKIRGKLDNYLFRLWMEGKLSGAKTELAYYVKIGFETMTAADIAQHKKIAVVGIATKRPAEFIELRLVQ